mmetsp:Transcript_16365/g.47708  ORF Transcript_16365/g.47708 Transcript_16365/m.47708 type:complete len:241 (+) Transcript_16365:1237-1959(+)
MPLVCAREANVVFASSSRRFRRKGPGTRTSLPLSMRSKSSMSDTMFSMMVVHVVSMVTACSPWGSRARVDRSGSCPSISATFLHASSGLRRSCITTRMSFDLASLASLVSAAWSSAASCCFCESCHAAVVFSTDLRKCHCVRSARTRSQWARATAAAMREKTAIVRTASPGCVVGMGQNTFPPIAANPVIATTKAICACCIGVKSPATMIMASPRDRASASDHSQFGFPLRITSASAGTT